MAYTIWDKVFDENGGGDRSDWNNPAVRAAWAAYDAAGANKDRDVNEWYNDNNAGYNTEQQAYKAVLKKDNAYLGKQDDEQTDDWGKLFKETKDENQKAANIKNTNSAYYDDLYSLSDGNVNDLLKLNLSYNKQNSDNVSEDAVNRAKDQAEKYRTAKQYTEPYSQLQDNELSEPQRKAKDRANLINDKMKANITNNRDIFNDVYLTGERNPADEANPIEGFNYGFNFKQLQDANDLDTYLQSMYFNKSYDGTNLINNGENSILNNARKSALESGSDLLNDYWARRNNSQSNKDPRTSNNTATQTGQAWTDLWNRYGEWMKDGHQESMDDFNKFYDTMMSEQERALLEKDVANNWGFNSWADMWDITNGADRFNKAFKAGVTGENGAYGMKEVDHKANDQIDKSQRYYGQDLMEKMFGRNANQRMVIPEYDESGNKINVKNNDNGQANENVYTEVMRDATGNALSDIDSYLKTADETAPNLVDLIQTDPGKVKELLGNNTLTLNDYSRKLVDSGYQSPLFNTGKTFGDRTIPEAEMIDAASSKGASGEDLTKMKTSEFSNPRYVDYATALLNTYLNAADLANQDTSSGYTAIDSGIPQSLQNVVAANNNANQNLLNQYLNYTESDEDKKAGGTSDQPMGDLSYSIFDNNEPFTYTGNGQEQGDVDLSALYNTQKKLTDVASAIKNNQQFGNPFNVEMLRRAVNKGRGK